VGKSEEPLVYSVEGNEKSRCELLVGAVSLHTQTAMRVAEDMLGNIVFFTEKVQATGKVLIVCERKSQ
jgi:hypothetical protein